MDQIIKKVLIITYYWPRSGGAGVQRWLKFTKYLPEYGWEPIVLTVKEENASYAQWDETLAQEIDPALRVIRTPSFEPYSIYTKLSGKKEIPFGGFSNEGSPTLFQRVSRFVRGNFFIPDPRRGWNHYAIKAGRKLLEEEKFDAIITTGPPHSTHLIGLQLKNLTRVRWIADFRDPWTDIYYYRELSHSALAKWYDRKLEKKVLLNCDMIVTVGNVIKNLFLSKSQKLADDKIEVITNGYDPADFKDCDKKAADRFTITYTGTISLHYRLDGFVDAMKVLPDEIKENMYIRIAGSISQNLIDLFQRSGLSSQLDYKGYVSHQQSIAFLFESSVLLLLIPEVPENKGILTGKFFEYLAAGKPILAIGPKEGDVADILKETGAGIMVEYDNVSLLKEKIRGFYNEFKAGITHGPSASVEKYSRKNLTGKIVSLMESE